MKTEGKWIKFVLQKQKSKTQVWDIIAKQENLPLGYIAWFPRWRCYAFFPNNNMVFETDCLKNIIDFISELETKRKENKI